MIIYDYRKLMVALVSVACLQYASTAQANQGDNNNPESAGVQPGFIGTLYSGVSSAAGAVLNDPFSAAVGLGTGVLQYITSDYVFHRRAGVPADTGLARTIKALAALGTGTAMGAYAVSQQNSGEGKEVDPLMPEVLVGLPDPVSSGGNSGLPKPPEELAPADTDCNSVEHQRSIQADQLRVNTQRLNMAGQYVEYTNNRVDHLNNRVDILDNQVGQLRSDLQKLEKKAIRGIASTAALGAATTVPANPGKIAVGVGAASYEGTQAVAFAVSYRPEKLNRMSFQAGIGTATGGKPVMRLGGSYEF